MAANHWNALCSAGKSKMLHSMINKAKEGGEVRGGVASDATMNFEGRSALGQHMQLVKVR